MQRSHRAAAAGIRRHGLIGLITAALVVGAFAFAAGTVVNLGTVTPAVAKKKAAKGKTLKASARVRSIPDSKFRSGPPQGKGKVLPIYGADVLAGGQGGFTSGAEKPGSSSRSLSGGSSLTASLPAAGPPVLINKPGMTIDDGTFTPPDSTGAIGPNHYVEMVNSAIAVYDRSNLQLIAKTRSDMGFTNGGDRGFIDPQIQWDQQAGRWFYAGIGPQAAGTATFTLVYGWSKTSDPSDLNPNDGTSGWCQYVITPPPDYQGLIQLDDYPKLGHSDTHLMIGTNVFRGSLTLSWAGSRIWTIPKPTVGSTNCPAAPVASAFGYPNPLLTSDGHQAFTPVPANTIDTTDKGYVVAADNPGPGQTANQIMAWHVEGPAGSPVLVQDGNMNVSSFGQPQAVPQPGTLDKLDTAKVGSRLTAAVMDADPDAGGAKAVWTQHTIDGPGGRSQVRWYELLPATTTVRQEGTLSSSLHYLFNGAISPTRNGNEAAINYNIGSSTQVAQIAARTRRSSTTLGDMSGETIVGTSDAAHLCGGTGELCRWGDYSGASPDHRNAHAVWGTNMLSGPPTRNSNWKDRNFAVSVRRDRLATLEDGQLVHPLTGFDAAFGQVQVKGPSGFPPPYEGSKHMWAVYFPSTGPAQGRYNETLPNGSDVWYGSAFYLDNGFTAHDNVSLIEWSDPLTNVHGGVSLRTDDQFHVVRGNIANPAADINVGPSFALPEGSYFWLEVHQRLDTENPLTEVFLNGRLISTSAAQNNYADSAGIPSRINYGIGTTQTNSFQIHLDRAELDVRQVGAVGAPATPTGFTGSGQDRTAILYWNAVPGATGYRVYKQATDGTWAARFDTTTTAVFEPGLTNCTTYRYRVAAYDSAGLESVVSEPLTITPKAPNQTC
jgi:hypothetical protein